MPTILSHPVVPIAIAWGLGRDVVSTRLLAAGVAASVIPDLDVLAFRLGIPYAAEFGHRGFSHSVLFALLVALIGASLARQLRSTYKRSFWYLFAATASHGMLDAFTNGGLGIALLWPIDGERWFAPFRPIEVAPLSLARLLSPRGAAVLSSELVWVWLPFLTAATLAAALRRQRASRIAASEPPSDGAMTTGRPGSSKKGVAALRGRA